MSIEGEGTGQGPWVIEGTDVVLYIGGVKVAKIDANGRLTVKAITQARSIT